jgi:hypothetical protein
MLKTKTITIYLLKSQCNEVKNQWDRKYKIHQCMKIKQYSLKKW